MNKLKGFMLGVLVALGAILVWIVWVYLANKAGEAWGNSVELAILLSPLIIFGGLNGMDAFSDRWR